MVSWDKVATMLQHKGGSKKCQLIDREKGLHPCLRECRDQRWWSSNLAAGDAGRMGLLAVRKRDRKKRRVFLWVSTVDVVWKRMESQSGGKERNGELQQAVMEVGLGTMAIQNKACRCGDSEIARKGLGTGSDWLYIVYGRFHTTSVLVRLRWLRRDMYL